MFLMNLNITLIFQMRGGFHICPLGIQPKSTFHIEEALGLQIHQLLILSSAFLLMSASITVHRDNKGEKMVM